MYVYLRTWIILINIIWINWLTSEGQTWPWHFFKWCSKVISVSRSLFFNWNMKLLWKPTTLKYFYAFLCNWKKKPRMFVFCLSSLLCDLEDWRQSVWHHFSPPLFHYSDSFKGETHDLHTHSYTDQWEGTFIVCVLMCVCVTEREWGLKRIWKWLLFEKTKQLFKKE